MRKFAVLGASALALALAAAPAFASPPRPDTIGYWSQNPHWGESVAEMNGAAPAPAVRNAPDQREFRAQAPDADWSAPTQNYLPFEHHGR